MTPFITTRPMPGPMDIPAYPPTPGLRPCPPLWWCPSSPRIWPAASTTPMTVRISTTTATSMRVICSERPMSKSSLRSVPTPTTNCAAGVWEARRTRWTKAARWSCTCLALSGNITGSCWTTASAPRSRKTKKAGPSTPLPATTPLTRTMSG